MRFASVVRVGLAAALVLAAACDAILGIDDGIPRDGGAFDGTTDAAFDAGDAGKDAGDAATPMCDPDAAFPTPKLFTSLDTAAQDAHLRLVPGSELAGWFQTVRDGGAGSSDIYSVTRTSIGDTWKAPASEIAVNTATADTDPSVSADQLTLYLTHGGAIWRATRAKTTVGFGAPTLLTEIDSSFSELAPYLVDDGSALYFASARDSDAGVEKLFVTQPLADGGFTAPAPVGGTNLDVGDNRYAAVTADQLVMYFASNRTDTGTQGGFDVFVATRATTSLPFGAPRVVAEVSSSANDFPDWISADRCRLYFTSNRTGTGGDDVYVATKTP